MNADIYAALKQYYGYDSFRPGQEQAVSAVLSGKDALCVMPTAMLQLSRRLRSGRLRSLVLAVLAAFTAFMVVGRLLSGVHWLTDIVGGVLLSAALVCLYAAAADRAELNQ